MASRGAVVAGAIGVGLIGLLVLQGSPGNAAPLDPRSDAPDGTSALVSLLEGVGANVELSVGLPGPGDDVALLLADDLDEDQTAAVLDWVRAGGTLVVTDPDSSLAAEASGLPPLPDDALSRGICTIGSLDGVDQVDGGSSSRFNTAGSHSSCVGSRNFAFVVAASEGSGDVVSIGGADFATNARLDHDDNAVLAAALLAPREGTTVRVVDAPLPAGGGDKSLGDLVSDGVRRLGWQLAIAFLIYAGWRAVRLGRPVPETQPVEIAGSELVGAAGRLLERGRAAGPAAEVLQSRLRRALAARFGVPPGAPPATLVSVVSERTNLDRAVLETAVGDRPVTTDDDLVAVAQAVSTVHQEVLR